MKKCICKKCEDCRLFLQWDMVGPGGLRKTENRCAIMVVAQELPMLRGSVDGCQEAANETRNRTLEFGRAAVETLVQIKDNAPKLLS